MNLHKVFSSKNFPAKEDKKVREKFEAGLKKILSGFGIIEESKLDSVFIGVLYKLDIQQSIQTSPDYSSSTNTNQIKLYFFDEPNFGEEFNEVSVKQSSKNDVFKLAIKKYIDDIKSNFPINIAFPISIICIYNKQNSQNHFDDIAFKTLKNQSNNKSKSSAVSFLPTVPIYNFDRVILNKALREEIKKTLILIQKRDVIYDLFGFREVEPKPKVILNFHGVSGTGKTITAHALTHELDKMILALNYAEIESKYVGEAPKNLVNAFECAKKNNAVLFFDEADSFLGKRIKNVSSSSDQAVNSLRSQMLILLEQHEGIVIFATNLAENYDKAFESRILKHLKFELPDIEQRKKLINLMLPKKLPYRDDIRFSNHEINTLSELSDGFSGRLLKNGILDALTNAVMDNREYVIFNDFDSSFQRLKKSIADLNGSNNFKSIKLSHDNLETIESVVSEELSKSENKNDKKDTEN